MGPKKHWQGEVLEKSLDESLEALYRLYQLGAAVPIEALAKKLQISRVDAIERIVRLQALGFVASSPALELALTHSGAAWGTSRIRRHRLVERLLHDQLGLPWEQVHQEAARIAPAISCALEERLDTVLGRPDTCPHGNPIPAADGSFKVKPATPLDRLRPGSKGAIATIQQEEPQLLQYLTALGLFPKTELEVEEVAPMGGPIVVRVGASRYALGREVASRILVREV
ncbi:MAG: metal-dependent transcriptional regulator [candidate division NC10 bacterium]|nr:metal-dependent transcriptional regulator [candidate division NC10 bacterium]